MGAPQGKTIEEILSAYASYTHVPRGLETSAEMSMEQALSEIEALVNKELIGEGEIHVSHVCPQDNIHCAKYSQRCQTRNWQRDALTKITRKDK